jgi:hypothetical protein
MRIIRPYGQSRTELTPAPKRVLHDNSQERRRHEIADFAANHDELVIAQWISIIDKIATKPRGKNGATAAQRALREKLGEAAWARIEAAEPLRSKDKERRAFLKDLWTFKIHPYGNTPYKPKHEKGEEAKEPDARGRRFVAFAGDIPIGSVNPTAITDAIFNYLHENARCIKPGVPPKPTGLIAARAESIARNVLKERKIAEAPTADYAKANVDGTWTFADQKIYADAGNVAKAIFDKARETEAKADRNRVALDIAATCLFDHWKELFPEAAKKQQGERIKAARDSHASLFALHMAVRDCYRRLLKDHRKDTRDHRRQEPDNRKISKLLPKSMDELFRLIQAQRRNRDLTSLVRLGRIIHYEASGAGADSPEGIDTNWPADVSTSGYWTSDKQAEIKRAEAFVRVWRNTIALGALTLTNWASMKQPFDGDILGSANIAQNAIAPDNYDAGIFDRRADVLFGKRAALLLGTGDGDRHDLILSAIDGMRALRNSAFHFKGRGGFLAGLTGLEKTLKTGTVADVVKLWESDAADRNGRLKATLRAAHLEHYFTKDQNAQLLKLIANRDDSDLPLPRFSRVLLRAENAWKRDKAIKLPAPANRRALEAPARLCQYTVLKLLYERPFRSWFGATNTGALHRWIDKAIARATQAARDLNAKADESGRRVIVARAAANLPKPAEGHGVRDFLFDLSARTASEMRVQRGYESDGEKAREQASYIDDLLCDVLILALADFCREHNLHWVLELKANAARPNNATCDLDKIPVTELEQPTEKWSAPLYLLLHLVPVEEVGRLLHQLAKWNITANLDATLSGAEEQQLGALRAVLTLYRDMHDTKFEGAAALAGCEEFSFFFETEAGFRRVFPEQESVEAEGKVPKRGLREIARFGHLPLLKAIFSAKIADAEIDSVLKAEAKGPDGESEIARRQKTREDLHDKWSRRRKEFDDEDLNEYCQALAAVTRHRRAAAHVYLTDHVRLHRLVMAVLARLVDYSGLFERDLYFATLALLHRHGLKPHQMFKQKGLERLTDGRIFEAHDRTLKSDSVRAIQNEIARHFGDIEDGRRGCRSSRDIRNDLAHFNMLQGASAAPNLTHWVNQTRRLMAHDRKLKNAVSLSVKELVARHGLDLSWKMNSSHELFCAGVKTRLAEHLGKMKLAELNAKGSKPRLSIREALHGDAFTAMVAKLFRGGAETVRNIASLPLDRIDWKAQPGHTGGKTEAQGHARRPQDDRKKSQRRGKWRRNAAPARGG